MTLFSKYLVSVSVLGIIGTFIFILDFNDLSWNTNKEIYWGIISLVAIIIAVLVENRIRIINKKGKKDA